MGEKYFQLEFMVYQMLYDLPVTESCFLKKNNNNKINKNPPPGAVTECHG